MNVGLIDVDSHNWPNLPLMKLSAWHKARGDVVEWWWGFGEYDRVYMSKVFDETYTPDIPEPLNTREIIKGGTGYGLENKLPDEVEHEFPDYSIYPQFHDTAYGFLTRGCPRACPFCVVSDKEGRRSVKTADLAEFWDGQKHIKLLDANLLACPDHMDLLEQLAASRAYVDFTQGLDCRLLTEGIVSAINDIRLKEIHFAWDSVLDTDQVIRGLQLYAEKAKRKVHSAYATVYVLTNYGSSLEADLFRVETLRNMGYDPYIMVYDKPNAPKRTRDLQRYCNNRKIFKTCKFEDYKSGN